MFLPFSVKSLKASDGPQLHALFLIDPGSPHTYLRRDTQDALFPRDIGRRVTRVLINKLITPMNVSVSYGLFENVDILRQNFLLSCGYDLAIKYKIKDAELKEGSVE